MGAVGQALEGYMAVITSHMDKDGMFPPEWLCVRCGRVLNADGGHPAELYAGTYNGLCSACTGAGPYLEGVFVLDGAWRVNYPPHCPSWRRDRERFTGYADCGECHGSGVTGWGQSFGGSRYREYCRVCTRRFDDHEERAEQRRLSRELHELAQSRFEEALLERLSISERGKKAREKALAAVLETPAGVDALEEVRHAVMDRFSYGFQKMKDWRERVGAVREPTQAEVAAFEVSRGA